MISENISKVEETPIVPEMWEKLEYFASIQATVGITEEACETNAWVNNERLKL